MQKDLMAIKSARLDSLKYYTFPSSLPSANHRNGIIEKIRLLTLLLFYKTICY